MREKTRRDKKYALNIHFQLHFGGNFVHVLDKVSVDDSQKNAFFDND